MFIRAVACNCNCLVLCPHGDLLHRPLEILNWVGWPGGWRPQRQIGASGDTLDFWGCGTPPPPPQSTCTRPHPISHARSITLSTRKSSLLHHQNAIRGLSSLPCLCSFAFLLVAAPHSASAASYAKPLNLLSPAVRSHVLLDRQSEIPWHRKREQPFVRAAFGDELGYTHGRRL